MGTTEPLPCGPMPTEHLVSSVADAPWLPPGSRAEAWVGDECISFDPAIIVRALLARQGPRGTEFFTVPTPRGHDLPSLHLGSDADRMSPTEGLKILLKQTLGRRLPTRCVGFIRNVVPHPDDGYPHPTPHAHVPVFSVIGDAPPIVAGAWHALDVARLALSARHWWPIMEHHLGQETDVRGGPDEAVAAAPPPV